MAPALAEQRRMYYRIADALQGMGLIPNAIHHRTYASIATTGIDPDWVAWCTRWRATTTIAPSSARSVYYAILKAGRWLKREHPEVCTPDGWTRDVALAYVSAVIDYKLGEFVTPDVHKGRPSGTPLAACSKGPTTERRSHIPARLPGVGMVRASL